MSQLAPFQTPEEMQSFSNWAHWAEGALLAIAAGVALAQAGALALYREPKGAYRMEHGAASNPPFSDDRASMHGGSRRAPDG